MTRRTMQVTGARVDAAPVGPVTGDRLEVILNDASRRDIRRAEGSLS
jgi:hypothetical protein